MKFLQRKQIVALSFVLMIVVAGYLQYSYKKSSLTTADKDGRKIGEAVFVGNSDQKPPENNSSKDSTSKKAETASKQANDYFSQAKLDKEVTRSKDIEDLKAITSDSNASKDVKAKAYDQEMKVIQNSEKEQKIESLLKQKGFSDAVALFGDDGSLDIVVKTSSLSSQQSAQIVDVATRQANVDINKLHVKNMF